MSERAYVCRCLVLAAICAGLPLVGAVRARAADAPAGWTLRFEDGFERAELGADWSATGLTRIENGVLTVGRDTGEKELRRPGRHLLNVWLAERSLRSEQEGWGGGEEVTGLLTLAARVAEALEGSIVDGDRRLRLIDEQPVSGPVGLLVWEQRYALSRQAEMVAPTFGGRALAGADSEMRVELGPLVRAGSYFAFPGVNGVFERNLGLRQRSIIWRGRLRASDDAALNAIEADIEGELADGQAGAMIDAWGRSHGSCGRRANAPIAPKSYRSLHSRALECRPGSSRTRANEVSAMRRRAFVRSFAAEPPSASVRGGVSRSIESPDRPHSGRSPAQRPRH